MKALDRPISKQYPPLRLFRDDLERIEGILKESAEKLEIKAEGFLFDSIAEMAGHFGDGPIRAAEISTSSPYVTIELTKM